MKRLLAAILILSYLAFSSVDSYAYMGRQLTDYEIDQISAAGFDINISEVIALRQAVGAYQANIAAVSGLSLNAPLLNNANNALVSSGAGATSIKQENIACVAATQGNIENALINNSNTAQVDFSAGQVTLEQKNITALVAPNGDILNSAVNHTNLAILSELIPSPQINQESIFIFVTRPGGTIDAPITNSNTVIAAPSAIVNTSTQVHTYSVGGIDVVIGINGVVNLTN